MPLDAIAVEFSAAECIFGYLCAGVNPPQALGAEPAAH